MTPTDQPVIPLIPLGRRVILKKVEYDTVAGGLVRLQSEEAGEDEGTQEYEIVATAPLSGVEIASPVPEDSSDARTRRVNLLPPPTLTVLLQIGDHVYLARHKHYRIALPSGDDLYAADVDDILALVIPQP